jgi:RNA 2',3'-cyclic 3'-phosphodiesterase
MTHTQLKLDLGGDPNHVSSRVAPNKERIDLFVALQPAEDAKEYALGIADDYLHRLGIDDMVRPLHVSLQELGLRRLFSTTHIAEKMEALSIISFQPFMLEFDEILTFGREGGKRPLVLCCSQENQRLLALRQSIFQAQWPPGLEAKSPPPFTAHMTLFYTHRSVTRQELKKPVRWLVQDFHIIWSHSGECRHESLWHWPPSA